MKLTKIYTKTGDKGETSLVGGIRIAKNDARIEAYGTVDELSSHLGLLVAMLSKDAEHEEELKQITETLERIQNNLFSISSILATDAEALKQKDAEWVMPYLESLEAFNKHLGDTETPLLEQLTDQYNAELEQLSSFILPGGSVEAAQCHVCRAVCRRTERKSLTAYDTEQSSYENLLQYMNRLSDYLFVLARKINLINGESEKTWQNTCK